MSSYIVGLSDTIPQAQPFQVDFNYYSGVLSTKQNQYDQGLKKINTMYGSALNSPMTRTDNIDRRDKYFKTIEQDIQKAAKMDLSIDQNVNVAKTLFDPILNDKHIVNDMVFTKGLHNAYAESESYRNCIDPEKCGGKYSEDNVRALHYAAEDYQKASPDEALRYSAPKYVPDQDVFGNAMKAAKEFGFNVTFDHVSHGYQIKDTNGQLLLGTKGDGVLQQFLYGIFGQDPKVQAMYQTKALLARRDFAKTHAMQFGSEDAAERHYLNTVVPDTTHKLEKSKKDLHDLQGELTANQKALSVMAPNSVEGDGVKSAYDTVMSLLDSTKPAEEYHTQVENLIKAAPNSEDINSMRNRVDGIVANGAFMGTINSAAYTYAMGTSKQEIKGADPYALSSFNHKLDLDKAVMLKGLDQDVWTKQQVMLGNIDPPQGYEAYAGFGGNSKASQKRDERQLIQSAKQAAADKGLSNKDLLGMGVDINTPQGVKKAIASGLLSGDNLKASASFISPSPDAEVYKSNFDEYTSVIAEATDKVGNKANQFLANTLTSKIQTYKSALVNMQDPNSSVIRQKLISDVYKIFKGTSIDPNDVLDGRVSIQSILDSKESSSIINNAFSIRKGDISADIYNKPEDEKSLSELEVSYQALAGLRDSYRNQIMNGVNTINKDLMQELKGAEPGQFGAIEDKMFMLGSMFGGTGVVDPAQAKTKYLKVIADKYSKAYSKSEVDPLEAIQQKVLDASKYFDDHYSEVMHKVDTKMTALGARADSKDAGGMEANKNAAVVYVDGDKPLDSDFLRAKELFNQIKENPNQNNIFITGGGAGTLENTGKIQTSPDKADLFTKTFDVLNSGETKNFNMSMHTMVSPPQYTNVDVNAIYNKSDKIGDEISPQQVAIKVVVGEDEYKKMYGKKKTDTVTEGDRTFVLTVPPSTIPAVAPYVAATYSSPEDKYLRMPGASLSTSIPGKGTVTILSDGSGGYKVSTGIYKLIKGVKTYVPYDETNLASGPIKEDVERHTVSKAFDVGRSILDQAARRFEYTKSLSKNVFD